MRKQQPPKRGNADGIVMGRFGAPHGVRGEIRLKSHTDDPMAILGYAPLAGADGRDYVLSGGRKASGASHDMLIVRVEGVSDRDAAAALNNIDLHVARDRLPEPDPGDFYHADLIGLAAETIDGEAIGRVTAIFDHGAGDLLEIAIDNGPPVLVPFTRAAVPEVDIANGRVVIDPPAGLIDDVDDGEER